MTRNCADPPDAPKKLWVHSLSSSMKYLPLILFCLVLPSFAAPAHDPVQPLPAFKVWPLFTLTVPGPPRNAENVFSFKTVDDVSPARWRGFIKFRSVQLKSGDEVVAIAGKPVGEMRPNEGRQLLAFAEPGKKIAVEVRQPGAKEIRKAVVVRIDGSSEIER